MPQRISKMASASVMTTVSGPVGAPVRGEMCVRYFDDVPSRAIAKNKRDPAAAIPRVAPNALMVAPRFSKSAMGVPTYIFARSPSGLDEVANAFEPATVAPNPRDSMAMPKTSRTPVPTTAKNSARGMFRRGLAVSSPRVADASNPEKDRKPNTAANPMADNGMPGGSLNTDKVSDGSPEGPCPPATLKSMTIMSPMIRATVTNSRTTSERPVMRTAPAAKAHTTAAAMRPMVNQFAPGQMPD